ncbi:ERAP1-like C-terminal domain-containing protein, partial [Saccharothrix sp. MB29]|nr:ERAP1-like C-terminal domain-containing protein [Saccharothrix sp. MB29]
ALTGSVLDDATVAVLRSWLDGTDSLPGLDVDTDLRWRLLQALVAHGAASLEDIAAEEERDPTATGRRRAESARALRPTVEAKTEAWDRAVNDDELPNAVSEAVIAGIQHP